MLTIKIPERELYDRKNGLFITEPSEELTLEHSLVSISKWESKWKQPFLQKKEFTNDEFIDYIRCMTIGKNINANIYRRLTPANYIEIEEYMCDPMTATVIRKDPYAKPNREIFTSEIIYYLMTVYNIPMECQKWHINRLITLIQVCNEKNKPAKKMSKRDVIAQQRALNASRRQSLHSRG